MQIGLKERLIGAVVLVVIAVIVIPWVLKGNSTPGGATVSKTLTLPVATTTAPMQTYQLPLDTSASNVASVGELPTATSVAQGATLASEPQIQPSAPTPAVAPAPRAPSSPQPPVARASLAGKWVVQAGSFDSERGALVVEHKLVRRGYHAYVSRYRARGRTYYRVRVGPFSDREEAARIVTGVSRAAGAKAVVMPNS